MDTVEIEIKHTIRKNPVCIVTYNVHWTSNNITVYHIRRTNTNRDEVRALVRKSKDPHSTLICGWWPKHK